MTIFTPRPLIKALSAVLIASALLSIPVSAAGGVYVNDSQVSGLNGLYVTGGGGLGQLGGDRAYALTGSGLAEVGAAAQPSGPPAHLSVSGQVGLSSGKVRVGLNYYDSDSTFRAPALDYANLENSVGSGYLFGFYDDRRAFTQIGYTEETKITVSVDKTVDTDSGHLGCYHIRLPDTYSDFESALSAASAYGYAFPGYYNGAYSVLVGSYDSVEDAAADIAALGLNGAAFTATNRAVTVSRNTDGRIIFEFDCGANYNLAVRPNAQGGKAVTWFKGLKYYGDFEYFRRSGGKVTVVNTVDLEDYVKGILPYEMSASWPIEALKCQAVCARSYAAACYKRLHYTYGFDVTNDASSQVYKGISGASANSDAAVEATAGQVITYGGSVITAYYYSSNGGGSEDSENVFGGKVGYARGVIDPYEQAADSINGRSSWSSTLSKDKLTAAANAYGCSMQSVTSVTAAYSDYGNVVGLTFTDSSGRQASVTGSKCYSLSTGSLGLNSIHYSIQDNGSTVTFTGGGWGHSVGMSQYGAYAMAKSYGFSYDQIINFYYTGVALSAGYAA